MLEITDIKGVGPKAAKTLSDNGYNTVEKIAVATPQELAALPGIGVKMAEKFITNARELLKGAEQSKAAVTKTIPAVTKTAKPKKVKEEPQAKPEPKKKVEVKKAKPEVKKPKAEIKKKKMPTKVEKATKEQEKKMKMTPTEQAISKANKALKVKEKKRTKAKTKSTAVKLSNTYGIITDIIHDKPGKSKNKSSILKVYESDVPLGSLVGRKVQVLGDDGDTIARGTITRIAGKKTSADKKVIVRMNKNVSAHVLTKKAIIY